MIPAPLLSKTHAISAVLAAVFTVMLSASSAAYGGKVIVPAHFWVDAVHAEATSNNASILESS